MSRKYAVAIYCTADDAYIRPSIIALESIRRFHPESSCFVIANQDRINAKNIAFLSNFDIDLIHYAGDHLFPNTRPWTMETFWKYKGPDIFLNLGFIYSMYIDGDILCVRPLDLAQLLRQIDGYAGIENQRARSGNFEDPEFIRRKYGLSEEDLNGHNTNAGVIIWNNRKMVELELFERMVQCFRECTAESPRMFRAVDQSLFALVSVLEPVLPWLILPREYNYRIHNVDDQKEDIKEDIRIYHFIGPKPWDPLPLKKSLLNPSFPLHRDKYFAFLDEQGVFNRDLTIKSGTVLENISKNVCYAIDECMTTILVNSSVVRLVSAFVALVRKIKALVRKANTGLLHICGCK